MAQELLLNLPKAMKGIDRRNIFKYNMKTSLMESIARRNDTHNRNEEANRTFRKFSL